MVEVQLISVKQISLPKGTKLIQSTLDNLRNSIQTEGLWNPIVLRPDPTKPGFYIIVQGRHRYHVIAKMMKEEFIQARVFTDMNQEEADLAALTENACRQAPSGTKRLLLIQEWQSMFRKLYPDLIGKKASGKAAARKRQEKTGATSEPEPGNAFPEGEAKAETASNSHSDSCSDAATTAVDPEPAPAPAAEAEPTRTFKDRVQATTGQSDASIFRDLRIVNNFTREQLEVLDPIGVGKLELLSILAATKGSENERAEIVNLVCSGMKVDEAIREVTGAAEVKDEAGRTKEPEPEGATKAGGANVADMPDDEWFETYCRDLTRYLGDPSRYKADALLFRWVSEARAAFRKKAKKAFARARDAAKGSSVGPFFFVMHRLLNASHPKDWLLCDQCKGKGQDEAGKPCKKCVGAGYFIKTEKYV